MSFEAPLLLLGLVLVPLAAIGYWLLLRRSTRYAVRFTNLEVLAAVAGRRRAWLRHLPAALLLASLAVLCVAFARPTVTEKAPNERASVVLVVDVSGSMRADDVKPSRLAAAKQAMRSFLDRAPVSLRVGVIAFSDEPQVVVSPTPDREMLVRGIDLLGPGFGTAIGDALGRCVELARMATGETGQTTQTGEGSSPVLKDEDGRALASILLLSDGAQTRGLLEPGARSGTCPARGHPRLHDRSRDGRRHDPRRPARAGAGDSRAPGSRDARRDRRVHGRGDVRRRERRDARGGLRGARLARRPRRPTARGDGGVRGGRRRAARRGVRCGAGRCSAAAMTIACPAAQAT